MTFSKNSAISIPELITGLILMSLAAMAFGGYRAKRLYTDRISAKERTVLILQEHTTVGEAGKQLMSKGAWIDRVELEWASKVFGLRRAQRGYYVFQGRYSYRQVLIKLARGQQDPVKVVVPPGMDRQTLVESVAARMHFPADSLHAVLNDSGFLAKAGLKKEEVLGRLWPDTYFFFWTASAKSVVTRLLETFNENARQFDFSKGAAYGLNTNEVLTLASIVEWESKDAEERKQVAGLYLNRLKKRMRLQADPTVAFAIGSRRRLTFKDYAVKHPYNTYQVDGLPPGPINNPSKTAIEAALAPASHGYIYMVASPTGKHVFTSTWEAHKIESEKWRRWLRQQVKIREEREKEVAG
jgi:UPF0755 protein